MKIIEHRRHSMRNVPDGIHLIQSGVDLARKIGYTMDKFDYVITSPKERAFETAIAMGFAVNETVNELASYGNDVSTEIEYEQLKWNEIKNLLEKENSYTHQFAKSQVELLYKLSNKIQDGEKLLLISHGGMIEISFSYLFMQEDHRKWGNLMGYCEGIRLIINQGRISDYEILRAQN